MARTRRAASDSPKSIFEDFLAVGVDAVTLGNHAFDQREALVFIERQPRLIRPVNFPPGTPGRGASVVENAKGARLLVVNVMGRIFMDALDDPFAAIKRELALCPLGEACDASIVDFHAEASSEKWAFGHFVDGKASLMVGTHTHTPSADHRILAGGTGFITDVGMTGDYDSVIGMDKEEPLRRFTSKIPSGRFEPASGAGDAVRHRRRDRRRWPDQSHCAGQDRRPSRARPNRTSGPDRDARSNHCL